jgi:parvulin-like peptidyl-prolyl isomerase
MRNCLFPILVLSGASLAWSQAAAPAPGQTAPTPPAASSTPPAALKARGPEAVAASDPNKVVAEVDGKPITAKKALDLLKALTPEERKSREGKLADLVQQLYTQEQLADQAKKMNMDQQDPWKDRLTLARDTVLAQAYVTHLREEAAKAPADDPKAYYDSHPDEFDQVKLSGIFVTFTPPGTPAPAAGATTKTEQQAEDKANELEKKLKAGGDFAALARTDNDNQAVASKGGELGTFNMGDTQIPPVLRSAIGKLQAGQVSDPVRISSAFLILKMDSRQKQAYADVQASLTEKLRNEKTQSIVKQQIDKYKIKVDDEDFFEAPGSRPLPTLQRTPAGAAK